MAKWALPSLPARFADAGHPPFVGRKRELERLEAAWAAVERGERQAIFVGGEPGSGKSRLAAETARALHTQNVAVSVGASSADLDYPYKPLVEALDHLLMATEPGALAHVVPDSAAQLLRLTEHIHRHRPDLESPPSPDIKYRRELFSAYSDLIRALAANRPVALFLEDLHWSSAPTRLMLSYLVQETEGSPLLVMGTLRSTAPDRSDDLAYVIADLYRLPGVERIDLAGLDAEDIESFIVAQAGAGWRNLKETAALLQDQTGGNPFFLREVWREVAAAGGFHTLRSGEVTSSSTIRDALERRIRSFGSSDREALELAAVLGDTFEVSDIVAASDFSKAEVLSGLDRATEYGLISGMAFQHSLVRQAVLDGLAPSRSAELHRRLALVVEAKYEHEPSLAPLLARLFTGAEALGSGDKSVRYLGEAARRADQGLAHEEAAELWEKAARALPRQRERREEMLLQSARSHMLAGDFAHARRLFEEVHASPNPRTALTAAIGFEDASWRPGLVGTKAASLLIPLLEEMEPAPDDPLYVNALAALGRAHTFSGDFEEARPISDQALKYARMLGDDRLIAEALLTGLHRIWSRPDPSEIKYKEAQELRELALRTRDYDKLAPAGVYLGWASYMSGNLDGWLAAGEDLKLAADKTGQSFWQWLVGCHEFCQHFMRGDFRQAEGTAERIRELGYRFGPDDTEGPYGMQMFMIRRETGGLEAVRPLLSGEPENDGTWKHGLLALYAELGMIEPAQRMFWDLFDRVGKTMKEQTLWPTKVVFFAEAAVAIGEQEALRAVEPLVEEYAGYNIAVGQGVALFGSGNRYLGMVKAALGKAEEAEDCFERALEMDMAMQSPVHQAETLARFTLFLRSKGSPNDTERAHELEARARALAEPRGHRRVLSVLEGSGDGFEDLPDGLTPREVDVLRLLAKGASNREIGDELYISQNTAANHVRSILIKTGSANRTAAAIYASERGLLV